MLVNLFLGGWSIGPAVPAALCPEPFGYAQDVLVEGLIFGVKALLILLVLSVASVLYARLRIDQLAKLGWLVLAPLALLQMLVIIWIGVG